ncbi:MAG: OadG family protein [Pseudomonadales bacterium]|nr:OadG family protein [Pseudomonadales bacterium]MED5431980.1 OadG family transporter subunit [Pseudomonadota bacterium]MEE2871251.1 OadG family transporter subunit [Pseudomonadota bacterium]|tara:strand:- start:1260 stop:1508 length:249 start_codon:yes stop_codon:yes gene_type:complete
MDSLMNQGLELMLVGMGVVFVFLIILVGVTTLMSALVQRFGQAPVAPEVAAPSAAPARSDVPPAAVIKAIESAVRQHRQSQS